MPIKSIGGNALNVSGWVLASQTTAPDTGITTSVYRGRLDHLAAAVTPTSFDQKHPKLEKVKQPLA